MPNGIPPKKPSFTYDTELDEFYEEKLTVSRAKSTGRYELPEYVKNVHATLEENYPDSVPTIYMVDKIIKTFWREVEAELLEKESVPIFGFGIFKRINKISGITGREQNYFKFKLSRHFINRMRETLGTLTDADKLAREKQKLFMQSVWEHRMKSKLPKPPEAD